MSEPAQDTWDDDVARGLVPPSAWAADEQARARGRVAVFNAGRPGGLDGWTMDARQYAALRELILEVLAEAGPDGVLLKDLVARTQAELGEHELFPKGRLRNYCTFTKVDLEARGLVRRLPVRGAQRVALVDAADDPVPG
ncbi:DUF6958 family protein [Quadrisphaera sp. KR29]|uniref:DUF6958 family protein n=1 Tax=Quadrisphaera sp. KR29 TaxID=3461391 RepID=UPI004044FB36